MRHECQPVRGCSYYSATEHHSLGSILRVSHHTGGKCAFAISLKYITTVLRVLNHASASRSSTLNNHPVFFASPEGSILPVNTLNMSLSISKVPWLFQQTEQDGRTRAKSRILCGSAKKMSWTDKEIERFKPFNHVCLVRATMAFGSSPIITYKPNAYAMGDTPLFIADPGEC